MKNLLSFPTPFILITLRVIRPLEYLMNYESRLALTKEHYRCWLLSITKIPTLEDLLSHKSPKTVRGEEVIEFDLIFYKTGISLKVLQALVAGDLDSLQKEGDLFEKAFGEEALPDGTYTLPSF